ncbi:MAG: hypothetical protein QXO84_03630 [Candidatus Aenigmatarchaeota archaeon]
MLKLSSFLAIMALLSFLTLIYSSYLIFSEFSKFSKLMVYYNFCRKNGDYFLNTPTTGNFCKELNEIRDMSDISCELVFDGKAEREACNKLKNILEERSIDCLEMIFKNTYNERRYDVSKECETILNAIK